MDRTQIEGFLAQSLADRKLSPGEKQTLMTWLAENAKNDQQKGVIRHVAFDVAGQGVADPDASHVIAWLEDVMKAIVPIQLAEAVGAPSIPGSASAFFSPGEECLQEIVHRFQTAKHTADLCVFTITDDRISRSILEAHRRGVKVRIISDAEKANDLGSDLKQFAENGIAVKLLRAVSHSDPHAAGHMHHN